MAWKFKEWKGAHNFCEHEGSRIVILWNPLHVSGDKGTKLFHSLIKWNANKNFIASITREDGSHTNSMKEDTRRWNDALLAKTLWNIHLKKDTLWCKLTILVRKDFPLLSKWLLSIRDKLAETLGSIEAAMGMISSWIFGDNANASMAYEFFKAQGQLLAWSKIVWKPIIPPKFSFCLWLAVLERVLAIDRLHFLGTNKMCKLYE
ncbi:hypothetical protein M9H77_36332 [Catharanthus roseus]|uniref:Uncharacterized protein n=1 Tax=Catharanthus roseus TaxID=4058 RepID=A0ACB9ZVS1_CATRO|nr:hypothetical protein M9H77_36332 [Catharanthus roseus]